MLVDSVSDEVNPPIMPMLATPEHSDNSGSEFGREDTLAATSSPASRWNEVDVTSSETSSKRCRREGSEMDESAQFPPFANPFLQARLQEARLQQEHARLLQEAALRQEQLTQQHLQQQQQLLHQKQQQNSASASPSQQQQQQQQQPASHGSIRSSPENETLSNYLATKKSMDDVLKRLTSKMSHNSIDEANRVR